MADRLDSVLEMIYLMFNEGYAAQSGENLVRQELCGEALRIAQLLVDSSVSTPQVHALVALLAFQAARLPARVDAQGEMVLLEDQDRTKWDGNLVAFGFHHFAQCAGGSQISTYQLQAAIANEHARAKSPQNIDWKLILELYDQLMEQDPTPVVALNRVVAIAKRKGPRHALKELSALANEKSLRNYYLLPAVEGRLQLEVANKPAARRCFQRALKMPCSEPEKRFLQRKRSECARS